MSGMWTHYDSGRVVEEMTRMTKVTRMPKIIIQG